MPTKEEIIRDPLTGQQFSRDTSIPGSTYKPYTLPTSINGTNTQPTEDLSKQVTSPTSTPVPPVGTTLAPTSEPTSTLAPEEEKAQAINERLQAIEDSLSGVPTFKAGKEKEVGLEQKTKAVEDISTQLTQLQFESDAVQQQLISEAAAGGVTTAILGRKQAQKLREYSVKSSILQAQLAGAKGLLATAEARVNRAVETEFAPLKAELDAKYKNYELVTKSPLFTKAEKDRAEAAKIANKAKEDELEVQKTEKKRQYDILLEYISNGGKDTLIMNKISGAKSAIEAAGILARSGFGVKPTTIEDLSGVDAFARKLNAGEVDVSSIPQNIRSRVVSKSREFAKEDLAEDVSAGLKQGIKRDNLMSQLVKAYPEFSKTEIEQSLTLKIPKSVEAEKAPSIPSRIGGFFKSLFR